MLTWELIYKRTLVNNFCWPKPHFSWLGVKNEVLGAIVRTRILSLSTSYVRHMKLKHQKGKKADLAWNTRRVKEEGCRSHPFCIKYKTTTPLAALMRKWPQIVMAQLKLQGKNLLVCSRWDKSPRNAISALQV